MYPYQIENTVSGVVLGQYEGANPDDALEALARDAGYANRAEMDREIPAADGEIIVTRVAA
jgi:hypothetical protein